MGTHENGRSKRREMCSRIDFISDFDIVEATGVNISAGGICFHVTEPLRFTMRFEHEGELRTQEAQLAWVENEDAGGCSLGFQFTQVDHVDNEPDS